MQRVENGQASGFNTRRALGRAFDLEDIDAFNKPFRIPTLEELEQHRQALERKHITLPALP